MDKPPGPTSHDVVGRVRRLVGFRRVGHTGTLDPCASGLLLVCAGPATRLAEYLSGLDKSYLATARLGTTTETDDMEGRVTAEDDHWRTLGVDEVDRTLRSLEGRALQRPPAYSAKKVGGQIAHRLARRGEAVELEPVPVTVHEVELIAFEPPLARFRVVCSKGTYIRALARDLGAKLGTGAHLAELRRTQIGSFSVSDAVPGELPEDVVEAAWIPPGRALDHLPKIELDAEEVLRIRHGGRVPTSLDLPGGPIVLLRQGELIAVAEGNEGMLHPRKVFG